MPGISRGGWAGAVKLKNRDKKIGGTEGRMDKRTYIHTDGQTHPLIESLARD